METADFDFMSAFVDQYRLVHHVIREEIQNLDEGALGWIPCTGANSIAVLVTHLLGNEVESARTVAGAASDRDRAKEFEARQVGLAQLTALVDRADQILDDLTPRIGPAQLSANHVRPSALDKTPRSGTHVLMHSLAHAREHVGQLLLTSQLRAAAG
ncbi:MAG: DUF1572 family protein [Stellaceae bacterium]